MSRRQTDATALKRSSRSSRQDRETTMKAAIEASTRAALPAALAEPTVPVRRSWITLLFLANIGLWLAIYAPLQVLLPEQVQSLHDHITNSSNVVPSGTDAVLLSVVMGV